MILYGDADTSKYLSGAASEMPDNDADDKDDEDQNNDASRNNLDDDQDANEEEADGESEDPDKRRQKRRYNRLLKNFRVLSAEEVEELLKQDNIREE